VFCCIVLNHDCSIKTAILADCSQRILHVWKEKIRKIRTYFFKK